MTHATTQKASTHKTGTEVGSDREVARSGSFYRAHHFVIALLPMWVSIVYLFVKDLFRSSEPLVLSTSMMPHHYKPLDASVFGHVLFMVLCMFGIGFGLYIIRAITNVEEKNY